MRDSERRGIRRTSTVRGYDPDTSHERVIRDPMAVLLGDSSLSLSVDRSNSDPYNRIGPLANRRAR